MICGELTVPAVCVPKELGTDKDTGFTVVPVISKVCWLTPALSVMVTPPLIVPKLVGLKLTVNVHFAPGPRAPVQGLAGVRE